jgi:zinc/manganese transport system permease protein
VADVFASFMVNAWVVATIVAVVAGVVGFFTVLRGNAFAAHAIPNGAFAGAAWAALVGVNPLIGLGLFSAGSAATIGWLSRRGRRDVATALMLTFMLGLGSLFLEVRTGYGPLVYSLLFGEVLGISSNQVLPTIALAAACLLGVGLLYRPLLLSTVLPDAGRAGGISATLMDFLFLGLLALLTTMTVPVVGTLLIFSLTIGAPAAARAFTDRPSRAILLSVVVALATVWIAIAVAYWTNYPIGFFVGAISALTYIAGRLWTARGRRVPSPRW